MTCESLPIACELLNALERDTITRTDERDAIYYRRYMFWIGAYTMRDMDVPWMSDAFCGELTRWAYMSFLPLYHDQLQEYTRFIKTHSHENVYAFHERLLTFVNHIAMWERTSLGTSTDWEEWFENLG